MLCLKNPYISVAYEGGESFGGNQRFSDNKTVSHVGCGVIAATDLLIYLSRWHGFVYLDEFKGLPQNSPLSPQKYYECVMKMKKGYFPLIPYHGMNGLGLMAGMQLFFHRHKLPYSSIWCVRDEGIWEKVEEMLRADIPVIMGVGPNFPFVWRKGRAMLYTRDKLGEYKPASSVKAHFITITGIDEEWLEISSWGKRLYLNRRMYEEYVSVYSSAFVSNILYIRKKEALE